MAILPDAVVKAKYDFARSYFQETRQYPLQAGTNIAEEGQLMIAVAGATTVEATTSTGAGGEVPLGVNLLSYIAGTTFTWYETGTIPSVAPYTNTLKFPNIIDVGAGVAEAYFYDVTSGAARTIIAPGVPNNVQAAINTATGVVTNNVANAGHTFYVRYRFTMTTTQKELLIHSSHINRGAESEFTTVNVGIGHCVVYTTNYDARGVWTLLVQNGAGASPCLGPGGRWTTITLSGASTAFGRVISLPTADDPYLGIEYGY